MPIELGSILTSIISGIITIVVTVIAGLLLYAKRDFDRVQNMRRAFITELETVDLPTRVDIGDRKIPLPYDSKLLPTTVYESNTSNIGKLDKEEVESIVDFYSLAQNPSHIKEVMVEFDEFDNDPQADITRLEEKRELAVENLRSGLNKSFLTFLCGKFLW